MKPLKKIQVSSPHWAIEREPDVLSEIYNDEINIAIWQRDLSVQANHYVQALLLSSHTIALKISATPQNLQEHLLRIFPEVITAADGKSCAHHEFLHDLYTLLDMFGCLFDAKNIGLRINTLQRSMCPRFHVDHVPVRMVTTYGGAGTQWLREDCADRSQLGVKLQDIHADVVRNAEGVQQLNPADVALLKGERWEGNEGRGLIHRSPSSTVVGAQQATPRLLVTVDLV
jgi:Protein of unknown function (DUF1826)